MKQNADIPKENERTIKGYKTSSKTGNSILETPEGILVIPLNPMAYLYCTKIIIVGFVVAVVLGLVGSLCIYNGEENPINWLTYVGGFIVVLAILAFTVSFIFFSLVWWSSHKKNLIDKSAQQITLADGMKLSFNDISAVYLEAYTYKDAEANLSKSYQILLITQEISPETRSILTQLTKALERSVEAEDLQASQTLIRELSEKLNALDPQALGVRHKVLRHPNDLNMWNVAETLSRIFDVPILEAYGTQIVLRTPAMLDLPLSKQIRGQEELASLGAAPAGITANIEESCFQVSWKPYKHSYWFEAIFFALLGGGVVGGVLLLIENSWVRIAVAIAGNILLGLYFWSDWRKYRISNRPRQLCIEDGVLTFTSSNGNTNQLSLDHLEAVRVYIRLDTAIALISDNKIIHCETKTNAQARWLAQAVRCFVADKTCD